MGSEVCMKLVTSHCQKASAFKHTTYRKPTQVVEASSLSDEEELSLRLGKMTP